ncbi:spore cortex biosynthesis protein YabQ [Maledivibacter halophilus]|uniref:Spore cortex biosynthesis protein YabQ n=1 Tax=Maledivibacter halophilus TaxID=36842 RepID=A0A1T5MSZ4_9FIRM|nr:spore cortex biosynthesis protein YabQ [Maledivibacter halophilus]SKC91153.1 spore cortex biosynthesis protein YabQ [Maledivibacter halophilus]
MHTFVYYQLYAFLATFYGGIVIGFLYDIYRIYRSMLNFKKVITAIQDLLFWIAISIVAIFVLIYSNDGNVRGYSIMGFILGALVYNLLLSSIVVKTIKIFLNVIKRIFNDIYMGLRKIFNFFYKIVIYLWKKFYKIIVWPILLIKKIVKKPISKIRKIKMKFKKTSDE